MIEDRLGSAPVVRSETLHTGAVWDVEAHEVTLGDATIRREVIVHPGAVAVLALDEHDRALLVHQYRHPAAATLWELPAGLLDVAGEDPLDAARRELAEETDTQARDWALLTDLVPTGGGSTEVVRIYLATGLSATGATFAREAEEAEMEVRRVPFDEVVDAALAGRLHNAALMTAVLAVDASRRRGIDPRAADTPFDWHLPRR